MKQYFKDDRLNKQVESKMALMSEKEAVCAVVTERHKMLHDELNKIKIASGMQPDKYTYINHQLKVREIFEKYGKLIPVTEDDIIQMFSVCGESKEDYHIVKSKKVNFSSDLDAIKDEAVFYDRIKFDVAEVSTKEAKILDLIKKDKRITPEVIAKVLKVSEEWVTAKIATLTEAGILKQTTTAIGEDEQIERTLAKPLSEVAPETKPDVEIMVKYSYEGPKDDRNRPFCRRLLELDRLYSRAEIERISLRLGYSVWDRRGGWRTLSDGTASPVCRHRWLSHVVVKKRK